jgi:hypothetical protein
MILEIEQADKNGREHGYSLFLAPRYNYRLCGIPQQGPITQEGAMSRQARNDKRRKRVRQKRNAEKAEVHRAKKAAGPH